MTTRREFHDFAAEIAGHMDGWNYDAEANKGYDGDLMPGASLAGPGGRALFLRLDDHKGRVEVSGKWPTDKGAYRSARDWYAIDYGQSEPRISASASRGAAAVARDIERRLLPDIEPIWQKVQERIEEQNAYRARVAERCEFLSDGLDYVKENLRAADDPDRGDYDLGSISKLGWYGDMQVTGGEDGNCVAISLHSLTVEQARAVLEALKK
jgi:hypothetical protein